MCVDTMIDFQEQHAHNNFPHLYVIGGHCIKHSIEKIFVIMPFNANHIQFHH